MAYANFSEDKWGPCGDNQKKVNDCKNCLFALCVFHTMLLGRKKFGFVGWSRVYPFNTGDLTISSDVMVAYVRDTVEAPYADLRYIFGEIMYGGHITDPWDRRVDNNYLTVLVGEHTQEGFECMPAFPMPNPAETDYDGYRAHIEEKMPLEDPTMYGLHPNAGIGNLMNATAVLFGTIMTLQGAGGGGGGGGASMESVVAGLVDDYQERLPEDFNMFEIRSRITEKSPYVLCVLQEIERMNELLGEIRRTLIELALGLQGALNMSPAMEQLQVALFTGAVPPGWRKVAYASLKTLVGWWADVMDRVGQLVNWSDTLILPKSVWISGLFNANAFLTAINQTTARRDGLPLDTMDTLVDVTKVLDPSSQEGPMEDGALVHGMYMEGARLNDEGLIADSFLKDLHPVMPLLHIFSQQAPALETRFVEQGYYECPVFACTTRGASNTNAIFGATIKMQETDRKEKWISAAVCLLFSED